MLSAHNIIYTNIYNIRVSLVTGYQHSHFYFIHVFHSHSTFLCLQEHLYCGFVAGYVIQKFMWAGHQHFSLNQDVKSFCLASVIDMAIISGSKEFCF